MSKVAGTDRLNHWERLKLLHLYSQERHRERYMIIFLWKIAEGRVEGYNLEFTDCDNGRRGRMVVPKPYAKTAPAAVRRARESSLGIKGSRLFNLFLCEVPDQPTQSGMTRAAETNSLIDQYAMQVGTGNNNNN